MPLRVDDLPFVSKLRSVNGSVFPRKLGTETITEVRREETDKDPIYTEFDQPVLGTETVTKIREETTDRDPYIHFDTACN